MRRVRNAVECSNGGVRFIPFAGLSEVWGALADTVPLDRSLATAPRWSRRAAHWTRLALVDRAITNRDGNAMVHGQRDAMGAVAGREDTMGATVSFAALVPHSGDERRDSARLRLSRAPARGSGSPGRRSSGAEPCRSWCATDAVASCAHIRSAPRRTPGDVTASTRPRSTHWPALDGWRGFTIWFAISVHAGYFTAGGVLSLDTFFVLSGFLITGLLLREWRDARAGIDLLAFWARRARRLLPGTVRGARRRHRVRGVRRVPARARRRCAATCSRPLGYGANWRFIALGPVVLLGVHHAVARAAHVVVGGRGAVLPGLAARRAGRAVARTPAPVGDRAPIVAVSASWPRSARWLPRSGWRCSTSRVAIRHASTTAPTPARRRC